MLVLLLALQADTAALDRYRDLTAAEPRCARSTDSTDVTVCGLRGADRFRVTFLTHEQGDPLHEPVMAERHRYLARTDNCEEKSIFLVGCGGFGLSATVGGGNQGVAVRPMAK